MTSCGGAMPWFLAQLRPNCAHIAKRNLTQQGFQTFLPMQAEAKRIKDKFVTSLKPFFPGYIFVAFDPAVGRWQTINSTYGITRLVTFGQELALVPPGLVSEIMQRCDTYGKFLPPKALQPGDKVHLINGPFANFVATVERLTPDQRFWVLIDIMGREARMVIRPEQLRAV